MISGKDFIDKARNKYNNFKMRTIGIWILDDMLISRKNLKKIYNNDMFLLYKQYLPDLHLPVFVLPAK